MKKFIYRIGLFFRHKTTWHFFWQLTFMDVGRFFFKLAHNCNRCGSPNVTGYSHNGLHCPQCRDNMCISEDTLLKKRDER